jgi:S-DNA-T family DNA segregation ATPase FtsK/SpoIIIE
MRLLLTLTLTGGERPSTREIEVDAAPGSTAGHLLAAVRGAHPEVASTAVLSSAGVTVPPDAPLGRPPLVDGASLTLGATPHAPVAERAGSPVAVAVAHGPDAGRTLQLTRGSHDVGRSPQAAIAIEDGRLSRRHASIEVCADHVEVRDLGSTNGSRLDSVPLRDAPQRLEAGRWLGVGSSVLVLRSPDRIPAVVDRHDDGTTAVNRRPRRPLSYPPATLTVPPAPTPPGRGRTPWVAALVPLPVAGVLALFFGPMMLAFAVMSPVMLLGSAVTDRWSARRRYAAELAAHEAAVSDVVGKVRAAALDETRVERARHPDAAELLEVVEGPSARLWERRRQDPDFLAVSIGTCTRAGSVTVTRAESDGGPRTSVLCQAPAVISLRTAGPVGVAGDRERVVGLARLLVGQLSALHSPADLELTVLCDREENAHDWRWVTRLPHTRTPDGKMRDVFAVGAAAESTARVVSALHGMVRQRLENRDRTTGDWNGPWSVVVIDGSEELRRTPGLAAVLTDGPEVGVVAIALADTDGALPLECGTLLDLSTTDRPALAVPAPPVTDLAVDGVGGWWADRLSRALARLRDATPGEGAWAPTGAVSLSTATQRNLLDPRQIRSSWESAPATTSAVVGVDATGATTIDLATDGPHVLVGGTTGSGKSELLRTLVASLAAGNRPEHLSFVLVDYKGGAAFRACAALPHVAGVVTDLDDHLASRALTSLKAELKRRERLLAAAGVTDFTAYQQVCGQEPLARLVVVIDEFRALAEELPAFVDGMVRFAALGRSLGVHVVLATQRPAGVVTADIKANVNLRIALRMRDAAESMDVLDHSGAADISPETPGRALMSRGNAAPHGFQTATVGAPPAEQGIAVRVRERLGLDRVGPWSGHQVASRAVLGESELELMVSAIRSAATDLAAEPASPAWLPALPDAIDHATLEAAGGIPIGLHDVPEAQTQHSLVFDADDAGHWAFAGAPGSGRSTALRTIGLALTGAVGPDDLHLYAVSGGSLTGLAALPHCGAHVSWDDLPRLARLVSLLEEQVAERRRALGESGHATTRQWRNADPSAPPRLVLLIDDLDLVVQRTDEFDHGRLTERLLALLKDGAGAGLVAVLAGHRSLLVGRMAGVAATRVLLRLGDPAELVLAGLTARDLPRRQPPGRGLLADGTTVQLALEPQRICDLQPDHVVRRRPRRVDPVPIHVDASRVSDSGRGVGLGVGGDEATVQALDPATDGRRWLVAGPVGSGVSTTLALIATQLAQTGTRVALVASRVDPAVAPLVDAGLVTMCDPATPDVLVSLRRRLSDLAVLVDDAHDLLDTPVEGVLREIGALVERDCGLLVCGADTGTLALRHRGLAVEVARHRTGVVLTGDLPRPVDLWGLRLPAGPGAGPGRGYVVRRGLAVPAQIALARSGAERKSVA